MRQKKAGSGYQSCLGYGITDAVVKGSCRSEQCVVGYFAVRVILLPQNKTVTFSGRLRVAALLEKLALLPATVMVIRDNRLLTEDDLIQDEDDIEIRSVISGGL